MVKTILQGGPVQWGWIKPYDRYVIKLQARASALLQEHSDVVLFANYRISVSKSDVGFNKKVTLSLIHI